jgi:hypothetical protein
VLCQDPVGTYRLPWLCRSTPSGLRSECTVRPTRVKADSFRGFQNGASQTHRPPVLGQCMILSAGWYELIEAHMIGWARPDAPGLTMPGGGS